MSTTDRKPHDVLRDDPGPLFVRVPKSAFTLGLDAEDLALFAALCYFEKAGRCWPSQKSIAERCNLSVKRVYTGLGRLKAAGLIDWRRQRLPEHPTYKKPVRVYTITDLRKWNLHPDSTDTADANRYSVPVTQRMEGKQSTSNRYETAEQPVPRTDSNRYHVPTNDINMNETKNRNDGDRAERDPSPPSFVPRDEPTDGSSQEAYEGWRFRLEGSGTWETPEPLYDALIEKHDGLISVDGWLEALTLRVALEPSARVAADKMEQFVRDWMDIAERRIREEEDAANVNGEEWQTVEGECLNNWAAILAGRIERPSPTAPVAQLVEA